MSFIDRTAVSIGADPEFFVKSGDNFISGHNFPCGGKLNPRRTEHGAVQCDGLALELNVTPAFTTNQFIMNFRGALFDLDSIVKNWTLGGNRECYLVAEPVAVFSKDLMDRLPPHAKMLGCDPDFNAYTGEPNPTPNAEGVLFRTGAGHLHIGWTEKAEGFEHWEKCARLVKQLDFTVGLVTLLFDDEPRRRALYGKAGSFRPKHYGLEYRVPSNAWCKSEMLARTMFHGCMKAVEMLNEGEELDEEHFGLARSIIDHNQTGWHVDHPKLADVLLEEYRDNVSF